MGKRSGCLTGDSTFSKSPPFNNPDQHENKNNGISLEINIIETDESNNNESVSVPTIPTELNNMVVVNTDTLWKEHTHTQKKSSIFYTQF